MSLEAKNVEHSMRMHGMHGMYGSQIWNNNVMVLFLVDSRQTGPARCQ